MNTWTASHILQTARCRSILARAMVATTYVEVGGISVTIPPSPTASHHHCCWELLHERHAHDEQYKVDETPREVDANRCS